MTLFHIHGVREVVDHGFAVHLDTFGTKSSHKLYFLGGRDVHDVEGAACDLGDLGGGFAADQTCNVGSALSPGRKVVAAFRS